MNTNQQHKKQESENFKVEETERQQPIQESSSSSSSISPLPPSVSSSPSHEFSFTISVQSDKAKSTPSFAIDLSPADEIFSHGLLLPLHLLPHLPSSPRSSINSLDSFTFPIKEIWDSEEPIKDTSSCSTENQETEPVETSGRIKSKPFSFFGFAKRRKGCEATEQDDKAKHKRKLGFEVSQILKRYAKVVRPLFFRWRKEDLHIRRQAYSFSGNLNPRNKQELRGRRGEFSAPASMRTSPTNSGLLVAAPTMSSTSDSTMEELQSAIQAAIAHCKNSIAKEDKNQCQELI